MDVRIFAWCYDEHVRIKVCFLDWFGPHLKHAQSDLSMESRTEHQAGELWTFALISCLASRDISRSKFNSERYLEVQ